MWFLVRSFLILLYLLNVMAIAVSINNSNIIIIAIDDYIASVVVVVIDNTKHLKCVSITNRITHTMTCNPRVSPAGHPTSAGNEM